jgi:hypothetical protein
MGVLTSCLAIACAVGGFLHDGGLSSAREDSHRHSGLSATVESVCRCEGQRVSIKYKLQRHAGFSWTLEPAEPANVTFWDAGGNRLLSEGEVLDFDGDRIIVRRCLLPVYESTVTFLRGEFLEGRTDICVDQFEVKSPEVAKFLAVRLGSSPLITARVVIPAENDDPPRTSRQRLFRRRFLVRRLCGRLRHTVRPEGSCKCRCP